VKRPTPEFVGDNKHVLARVWVPQYAGASQLVARLVDEGVGPMSRPRTPAGYRDYIESTRNSKTLRRVLCDATIRFGDADHSDADVDDGSFVHRFAVLERAAQEADRRTPHDYQREAWNRLSAHLAEAASSGAFQGLVVMPTGSGKTFTAVRWLLQNVVARGQRVLWLAHRYELLNQAAAEVHKLAAYAGLARMRVRIVSGQHCAARRSCEIAASGRYTDSRPTKRKPTRADRIEPRGRKVVARWYPKLVVPRAPPPPPPKRRTLPPARAVATASTFPLTPPFKALAVKQPWASLIASEHRTIEVRTWSTKYRGPLIIIASKLPNREFARSYDVP
jgi:hypothetical protein